MLYLLHDIDVFIKKRYSISSLYAKVLGVPSKLVQITEVFWMIDNEELQVYLYSIKCPPMVQLKNLDLLLMSI